MRALEIAGPADGLLDDPLMLRVRGAGPDQPVRWRARLRDDDGRVWRAEADHADDLGNTWQPAKGSTGPLAAMTSLRPVTIDVRAEAADGRAAARSVTRRVAAAEVRRRRWAQAGAVLYLPAQEAPCATVLLDATDADRRVVAELAAPLLASRGVLVVVVSGGRRAAAGDDPLAAARELLAHVPGAGEPEVLAAAELDVPPGVPAGGAGAERAAGWDALLARLGARPRTAASMT